jgi:hypothetical protein
MAETKFGRKKGGAIAALLSRRNVKDAGARPRHQSQHGPALVAGARVSG